MGIGVSWLAVLCAGRTFQFMTQKYVYWRGSGEIRHDLLDALAKNKHEVVSVRNLEEVLDLVKQDELERLIIDASGGDVEVSSRIVELSGAEILYKIPAYFFGHQAAARSAVLKKQFTNFHAIDIPFHLSTFVELIESFGQVAPKPSEEPEISQVEQEDTPPDTTPPKLPLKIKPASTAALLSLASIGQLSEFDDNDILSAHPQKTKILPALATVTKANPWLGLHARRVTALNSMMSESLHFSEEHTHAIQACGLLLGWGLIEAHASVARQDFFLLNTTEQVQSWAASFRPSIEFLRVNFDEKTASIGQAFVQLLEGTNGTFPPEIEHGAQCLLVTELADRACWVNGMWNSYGAYRTLKSLRKGRLFSVQRQVAESAGRVLAEIVSKRLTGTELWIPGIPDIYPLQLTPEEAESQAVEVFGVEHLQNIELFDLQPGMRLARPVIALDGRLILTANVALDEDLIWRLWQLTTVRPLKTALVIASGGM